jgi:hypothetical protein
MPIKLTQQEIEYLRELAKGDQTMTGAKDRRGLQRLVDAGLHRSNRLEDGVCHNSLLGGPP